MIEQFPHHFKLKRKFLAVLVAACYGVSAQANPMAPQVVAGQASFNQQGNVFSITNTPNTIINWQSFSINQNEITRFIQQGGDSKVLNRIVGQDPSKILGALQSNGKVYLINPNGVLFGKDARVDVNGLVASSLAIGNADFLAGKNHFAGEGAGKVINQGSIATPDGGQVYLLGSSVENSGVITSPRGDVLLAAGRSVQLVDSANPEVHVVLSAPNDAALNLGQVLAGGGKVGIYGALVNQRGRVSADSAQLGAGGKIVLKSSATTMLEAGSVTSANNGAGQGGEIALLGQRVGLTGDARVQADGASGGGSVLLGGDYQGKNAAVPNAQYSFVGQDASISADALAHGDGGKIIVWGDQAARMHGALSARGGAQGGDGGLVETSGQFLDVNGARVDTRAQAAQGETGLWLLDPDFIEVTAGGSAALTDVADFNTGSGTTTIAASTINGATSNVLLQANQDISFNEAVAITAANVGLTAQARGHINVNAALNTNHGDIALQANLGATDTATAAGSGAVALNAAVSTGGGKLALSGAAVTLNAAANVGLGDAELRVNKAGGAVTIGGAGSLTGGSDSNAAPLFSFIADDITLSGAVNGGGKNQGTSVSFAPFTAGRSIAIAGSKVGGKLTLSPADLARVAALNVNIGSSAGGGVAVDGALDLADVRNVFIESAGQIAINSAVQADSGSGTLYVGTYDGSGAIVFGAQGGLTGHNVLLRSDNMDLGSRSGAISATGKASFSPYTSTAAIKLGNGATGASGTLVLTGDELRVVNAPLLAIGDGDGYTGALSVAGALDLSSAGSGLLQLGGASIDIGAGASVSAAGMLRLTASGIALGAGASASGASVDYLADSIALDGTSSSTATGSAGVVSFIPRTVSSVLLGAGANENGNGALGLSAAELNTVNAHTLYVDSSSYGGSVTINALDLNDWGTGRTLSVHAAGNVTVNSTLSMAGTVRLAAEGTLLNYSQVTADTVQLNGRDIALTSGEGQSITARNNGAVQVGTMGGGSMVLGSSGSGGGTAYLSASELATLHGGSLEFTGDANLTVSGATSFSAPAVSLRSNGIQGGKISVNAALSAQTLQLRADAIALSAEASADSVTLAPVSTGYGITVGAAACASSASCLLLNQLGYVNAPLVTIGSSHATLGSGLLTVAGIASTGDYVQRHANTASIALQSNAGIVQTGAIDVASLALAANGAVDLGQHDNHVQRLSAQVGSASGSLAFKNDRSLAVAGISAPGTVTLDVAGAITQGSGVIQADRLEMTATENIGTAGAALSTVVSQLSAESTAQAGSHLININNANYTANPIVAHAGKLAVDNLKVGTGNAGSVTLHNTGALVVDGEVASHSGKITLVAHSPLTINGTVITETGDIELTAGASGSSGDLLTFAGNAQVRSASGNVTLAAGAAIIGASANVIQTAPGKLVTLPSQNTPVPPVVTPPVEPPVVTPPVEPPVVTPPVVTPPVTPPVVTPPVVTPPVEPPVVTPPVVPPVVTPPVEPPVVIPPVTPPVEPPVVIPPVVTPPVEPPVVTPPVEPPVVTPPVVTPPVVTPPVEPPVVTPPVVTPPVVTPPVEPPVVTPPVVTPPITPPVVTPPLEPPVVTPPEVPPPSPDICTIAPNSALCQVLSPPTANEPVKPVQVASNEVISATIAGAKRVAQSEPPEGDGAASGGGGPAAIASSPDDKADAKDDTNTTASSDKSGTKNEPVKKLFCN